MPDLAARRPAWFRSLYWRIALGSMAVLAVLLLAQALVFLWMSGTIATTLLGQSPDRIAAEAAREVADALKKDPSLDLEKFVRDRYGSLTQPLMVVLEDGRAVRNHELPPPDGMRRWPGRLPGGAGGAGAGMPGPEGMTPERTPSGAAPQPEQAPGDAPGATRPGGSGAPAPPGTGRGSGARGSGQRPFGPRMGGGREGPPGERAPIQLDGDQVGIVFVAGRNPRTAMFLREFAPTQAVIGIILLVVGSAVASLAIFRPAHRRLRDLEHVARAIGEGNLAARAPESGGDEVAALARAFNQMAGDLEARTQAMEQSDRMRRQLLADVSHELKTPLAAIRGYAETLAMPEVRLDEETRRRYLDIVGDETVKLERIVGDLLDLARLEGGGFTLACEPVPAAQLFRRVADRHERDLLEKQVTLETSVGEGLEPIWCDPARLEQALQNLVANALRHTPEGGQITLAAERADGGVRIVVRDTGKGIPAEHLPHIFDRFYKTDASRTDPQAKSGSGLGLSIVKAIVELHGGRVSASNVPGGGAELTVTLPVTGVGSIYVPSLRETTKL
jgi:two-component system OmpR family sensor kinase